MNITEGTLDFEQLKLAADGFDNPRIDSGLSLEERIETARSILRHGLLVPLLVRSHDGLILAGKRRYHAINLILHWKQKGANDDDCPKEPRERDAIQAFDFGRIPVRFVSLVMGDELEYSALALVDNLFRADLTSYEITVALVKMSEEGKTGVAIAQMIGKSPSYVSRKLSAWKKAGPELREAWRAGMSEDAVEEHATLSFVDQAKALAGKIPRGRRGPAHRPSVDAVRDFLYELEQRDGGGALDHGLERSLGGAIDHAYQAGAIDALRWTTGQKVGADFVKLADPPKEG